MLRFHNTLTRQTEDFISQQPHKVALYTCGPTVYHYMTVGNWVAYIYWDTLVRVLIAHNYEVDRVMNITDVGHLVSDADEGEDKLEKGAKRDGKTAWEVAAFYTDNFLKGMHALNLIQPQHITKATDYIQEQIELVRTLKNKGYTYQTSDGIYFDTAKFPHYADFAQLDLAGQKAGARVTADPEKRQPSDFALWKFSPQNEKRDMEWDTPEDFMELGESVKGFPGWHIECSAMAMALLGNTLDIHTGGIDHIPVHHTNEIAQSEAASGVPFSHFWLHNNHLKVEGTKISKSLGNGFTLQDLAEKGFSALDFRMFALQSHYRSEGNFTWENLEAAKNRLRNWKTIAQLRWQMHDTIVSDGEKADDKHNNVIELAYQNTLSALDDDLNTPQAFSVIEEAFDSIVQRQQLSAAWRQPFMELLELIDETLGLNILSSTPDITDEQKQLIIKRQRAREDKDWKTSDKLRDQLLKDGILLNDTAGGARWSRL
jgi:cysteinyl-tRNA synthetase